MEKQKYCQKSALSTPWGSRKAPVLLFALASILALSWWLSAGLSTNSTVSFLASELLGCPTDTSVTVNSLADEELIVFFEFGTEPAAYTGQTQPSQFHGGEPIEVVIDGLLPDTRYYYRMRYRQPEDEEFTAGAVHSFRTQRARGSTFTFTVQSDSHIDLMNPPENERLYERTLVNVLVDNPDFHIDLGDTFMCSCAPDYELVAAHYLNQRAYLGLLCHSVPLYLVLGNHDGELGWLREGTADNVAIWAATARKLYYPNPSPNSFYSGNTIPDEFVGLREDYYAWEWGNALFVVLNPFWSTTTKPHHLDGTGSGDRWDWTLGCEQYCWFKETLEQSDATFKFVFSHHVTGGFNLYGRGGIEAAKHHLGQQGSYEWGGENEDGSWGFDRFRRGWYAPIHQVMKENGVTIYFHGHDHVFVMQRLNGIFYQECPQPSDAAYSNGLCSQGGYTHGSVVNNSGHIRVTVSEIDVAVEYVRAFLPEDENEECINGAVAFSYLIFFDSLGQLRYAILKQ